MQTHTLPIYNSKGEESGSVKLDPAVFNGEINTDALHQAVTAYLDNQRTGLAATKTRGEVSGGGRKPWKQKGTGRARVGSTRSPLWRHGGVVFGPHPRDFATRLPKKIKQVALQSALSAKLKENSIMVLDSFELNKIKTKEALHIFSALKCGKSDKVLLLLDKVNKETELSLNNLSFLNFNLAKNTNAYEVLVSSKVLITKDGLKNLSERLKG